MSVRRRLKDYRGCIVEDGWGRSKADGKFSRHLLPRLFDTCWDGFTFTWNKGPFVFGGGLKAKITSSGENM